VGDIPTFSRSILQLAGDPDLRQRMGIAAQARVTRQHGLGHMLDAYERLFWPLHKAHGSGQA
jgi:hypothetical protein